jgi:hypothetical protein
VFFVSSDISENNFCILLFYRFLTIKTARDVFMIFVYFSFLESVLVKRNANLQKILDFKGIRY